MKILFLHLSDAHFREDTKFRDINIPAMVNGLKQIFINVLTHWMN